MWVELNVAASILIFRDGLTAEKAAAQFVKKFYPQFDTGLFIDFLRISDRIIKDLWYIPEFAIKRLYFRRTRVPPLLWVFWDNIIINHTMRKIIRRFVHERREAVHDGYRALHKINKLKKIAAQIGIETKSLEFQYNTFNILAKAREYYFGDWDPQLAHFS